MDYLIKKAKRGDKEAFVELMELHKTDLYKIARSYLREDQDIADAMQETILVCYEKIDTLKQPKYFKTWIVRILINKCNDILRSRRRECLLETFPEKGETCELLKNYEFEELMDSLDEKYRLILLLYYGEGFKIREIAQILEMEENTVKTRLSRGRKQFEQTYCMSAAVQRR